MKYKYSYLLFVIFFSSLLLSFYSCSDNDSNEPLHIEEMRDGVIALQYPSYRNQIYIKGGTPPYNVNSEGSDILTVNIHEDIPSTIKYIVSGVGNTSVKISDAKGDKITVPVEISYYQCSFEFNIFDAVVKGDNLTDAQHEELKTKALETLPIKKGGGYKLIHTEKEAGIVYIYLSGSDAPPVESRFKLMHDDGEDLWVSGYIFEIDGKERFFELKTSPTRASLSTPPVMGLFEDVTEQFQDDYPGLESLITRQML